MTHVSMNKGKDGLADVAGTARTAAMLSDASKVMTKAGVGREEQKGMFANLAETVGSMEGDDKAKKTAFGAGLEALKSGGAEGGNEQGQPDQTEPIAETPLPIINTAGVNTVEKAQIVEGDN